MKLKQLGNGGGADFTLTNASFLIEVSENDYLLFDCGYNMVQELIALDKSEDPFLLSNLNTVFISDMHDDRNPWYPLERIHMIRLVYPNIKCIALDDSPDWDDWLYRLCKAIQLTITDDLSETTIYLHEKLEDLTNFTFRGIDYTNESYCKLYEIAGMHTTKLPLSGIQIRAQSIRNDIESNKQFLHPLVYDYIQGR